MNYIIHLLLDAAIILGVSKVMSSIEIKSYGTAVIVALLVGLFSVLIGWLISFPLNLVTLWLLTGLVRIVVITVMLKIVDAIVGGFKIHGWMPAFILAICIAIAGSIIDAVLS